MIRPTRFPALYVSSVNEPDARDRSRPDSVAIDASAGVVAHSAGVHRIRYAGIPTHSRPSVNVDPSPFARGPLVNRFRATRSAFFRYRREADVGHSVALALGFAGLTGLAAQIRIPLPFTPVPITLQTFAALLAGVALGAGSGGLSQGLYLGLGAAGVPWFTGWSGGAGHLAGPTGGYLIGFVVAAAFVGWTLDRYPTARRGTLLVGVLVLANFGIIHSLGLGQLWVWLTAVEGTSVTVVELLQMGSIPFIPGDLVKRLAAAAVARVATPMDENED